MRTATSLDVGLLGPFEVLRDGEPVLIAAPKQRALLVLLTLDVGRVVSSDDLADRLWGGDPPRSAATAVQVYISQLRKLVGAEVIATRRPGYALEVPAESVDAVRFERLALEGRALLGGGDPRSSEAVLREALAQWRGRALAEFVYEDWAAAPVRRMEEMRLAALEDRVDARLELGAGAELVGELEGLVSEHPLRERLRGHQMVALYRAGRQADALSAYHDARRALVDELGIEPSAALVELERRVLRQDPALLVIRDADAPLDQVVEPRPAPVSVEQPSRSDARCVCGAAVSGSAKFCSECGALVAVDSDDPERQQRKLVTVLFCDIVGSTSLGEQLDAEIVRAVMNRFFDAASAVVSAHGGSVQNFIGDAVVAAFGVPVAHEDDALRAVRAATEIRRAVSTLADETQERFGVRVEARIGLNSGEVVVGVEGFGSAIATGDAVNVAARLEQRAEPGEILLGDLTWQLVRDAVVVEPLGPITVKGKTAWVVAHRLDDVVRGAAGHARRMDMPLVGRESELRLLRESFARWMLERGCGLVSVLGTAGVGKSRLVAEFTAGLDEEINVAHGRCLSYGSGITYWPIAEAIRQLAGVDNETSIEDVLVALRTISHGLDSADSVVAGVAVLMGMEGEPVGIDDSRSALARLLEYLAGKRPLVLVIDDLQWAEAPLVNLVDFLAENVDAPALILCMARPELVEHHPEWGGGKLNATTLLLEPLDRGCTDELLSQLLDNRSVPEELRVRVASASAGNPLFAEELLAYLVERGHVRLGMDEVSLATNLAELDLPPSIRALIASRLDQLLERERGVLERGSVEGQVIHAAAVTALSDGATTVGADLRRLVRKQILRRESALLPNEEAFGFRHLLIRDVTYDAIPKYQRADWHESLAHWLEATAGERVSEVEEIIAYHLASCYRYRDELGIPAESLRDRAAKLLRQSADRSLARTDLANAGILLEQLIAILPESHPQRVVALGDRSLALAFTVGTEAAVALADQAFFEARDGPRAPQIYARSTQAWVQAMSPGAPLTGILEEFMALANEATANEWHGAATMAWMMVLFLTNDIHQAERARNAATHARRHARAGLAWMEPTINLNESFAVVFGSLHVDEAKTQCEEIFAATLPQPAIRTAGEASLGWLAAISGDFPSASEHFAKARADEVVGVPSLGARWHGRVMVYLDRPKKAIPDLLLALAGAKELGIDSATTLAALARAYATLERWEEVERCIQEVEEAIQESELEGQVFLCGARARLLVAAGEMTAAYDTARQAVEITRGTDYAETSGMALIDFGWTALKTGNVTEARSATATAIDLCRKRGSVAMLERAEAILNEIESATV